MCFTGQGQESCQQYNNHTMNTKGKCRGLEVCKNFTVQRHNCTNFNSFVMAHPLPGLSKKQLFLAKTPRRQDAKK